MLNLALGEKLEVQRTQEILDTDAPKAAAKRLQVLVASLHVFGENAVQVKVRGHDDRGARKLWGLVLLIDR